MDRPQDKEDWPPRVTYKLKLAGNARAFPWATLATYMLVTDSPEAKIQLIDFTKENAVLFDPQNNVSNVKLIHREYFPP
jgi:hypothetical protein